MKRDVYETITARILAALAQGVVPWQKPWDARQGRPRNLVSGKPYRGMNVWMLAGQGGSPFWLTERQARQLGGHVKQGERGTTVLFWKWLDKQAATADAGGRTIAVLGNGLDTVYPRENRRLAERIVAAGGAVVSEFALGVRPEASNFPRRNRIISGITLGALITEAGETSGTRWTVFHALEQNRELFCVPGSIYSENSKLTNRLIREGAKLVCDVSDILVEVGLDTAVRQMPMDLAEAAVQPGPSHGNGRKEATAETAGAAVETVEWDLPEPEPTVMRDRW